VGDVMLDVVVEVTAPFSHASDTPSAITTSPGGAAANQSVAMADAGATVALLGVVGDDPLGEAAAAALQAAGVDVALLGRTSRPTGVVVALVEPDGQRSMLTDRGANLTLDVAMVEPLATLLGEASHVHVSGYCLLDDESRPAGRRALELASMHGSSTSVDASSAGPLRAVGADRFLEWVHGVDYLFCNQDEGDVLTAAREPSTMARMLSSTAGEVVITMGADGALVSSRAGEMFRTPATVAEVGDTIGAGDNFMAAYLVHRLGGAGVVESLAAATTAAGRAVSRQGARDWAGYSRE
jgi:sugar/nucleoside kinase (ribokinase family)